MTEKKINKNGNMRAFIYGQHRNGSRNVGSKKCRKIRGMKKK